MLGALGEQRTKRDHPWVLDASLNVLASDLTTIFPPLVSSNCRQAPPYVCQRSKLNHTADACARHTKHLPCQLHRWGLTSLKNTCDLCQPLAAAAACRQTKDSFGARSLPGLAQYSLLMDADAWRPNLLPGKHVGTVQCWNPLNSTLSDHVPLVSFIHGY